MILANGGNHRKRWQPHFTLHPDLREHRLAILWALSQLNEDERETWLEHRFRDRRLAHLADEWGLTRDQVKGWLDGADRKLDRIFAA